MDSTFIVQFAAYQSGRGFSPKTVRRRTGTLRCFGRHIAPNDVTNATLHDVEQFVAMQRSAATRRAYRSDLMMFYRWANKRHVLECNPVADTDSVRVPRHLPRPVPSSQLPRILAAAPSDDVRTMCALAAYAGLRCAEISVLEASDIDFDQGVLVVRHGKGGKDRVIPLHPVLAELLRNQRRHGRLFDLLPDTVGIKISRHLRAIGINATAHKLRHTFGTELAIATNGNVVLISYLMGHSDVSTTMRYIGWSGGPGAVAIGRMFQPTDDDLPAAA